MSNITLRDSVTFQGSEFSGDYSPAKLEFTAWGHFGNTTFKGLIHQISAHKHDLSVSGTLNTQTLDGAIDGTTIKLKELSYRQSTQPIL